jgi:hypothetical protein
MAGDNSILNKEEEEDNDVSLVLKSKNFEKKNLINFK